MAGRTNAVLLVALYLTILDGSKRSFKLVYMPYGPLMCRGLCKDSPDAFYFMEQSLSCHRTPLKKSADNDNRTAICSFQYLKEDQTINHSSLAVITGWDDCEDETKDETFQKQLTAEDSPSRNLDWNHNITLHQACEEGDLCTVQYILSNNLTDINFRGKLGRTPVMAAALKGRVAVFDYLISRGCDLSAVDDTNVNVLHIACMSGGIDIVRKLVVNLNYDIENRGRKGMTPVMEAVSSGHVNVFRFLVSKGCNITTVDYNRNNVLHIACSAGHENMVKHILKTGAVSIDSRERYGRTSVMLAAVHGHVSVVELLVSNECNLFVVDQNRNNILHVACEGGHVNVVKYLVSCQKDYGDTLKYILSQHNLSIDSKGQYGRTPVMVAASYGNVNVVKYLVGKGCNLKVKDNSGNNILHVACYHDNVGIVKYILSLQVAEINSKGQYRRTPVMVAAYFGNVNVVKYLVGRGCNLKVVDSYDDNILHMACHIDNVGLMKYILSLHVAEIDNKGNYGRTPVMVAASYGNVNVVRYLVGKRCNLKVVDSYDDNILHMACNSDNVGIVKYIISLQVAEIDNKGNYGRTPVMVAAYFGNVNVVKYLVGKGCNLKVIDNFGNNILHMTCYRDNVGIVKYILSLQIAEIDSRGSYRRTPVMVAASFGNVNVVKYLVGKGCNLKVIDSYDDNILHLACNTDNVGIVKYILSLQVAEINSKGQYRRTPVMVAASYGNVNVVKYLVGKGCNLKVKDNLGDNILHLACYHDNVGIVKYVLSLQVAEINSKGNYGRTPVMVAAYFGNVNIVKYLVGKGCNLKVIDNLGLNILHLACHRDNVGLAKYILSLRTHIIDSKGHNVGTPVWECGCC